MKRWWILLLTLGVVFVLAVPAAATPGDEAWCKDHPGNAKCIGEPAPEDPDPTYGTVCGGDVEEGTSFEVDLGGRKIDGLPSSDCVDVMSDQGAWSVQVEVLDGTLRGMSLFIRDSISPGDGCFPGGSCGLVIRDIPDPDPGEDYFTVTMGMEAIPKAYINACNFFDDGNVFGEWVGDKFYEDFVEGMPSPLAFIPSISGSNDVVVKLTVSIPQYTD